MTGGEERRERMVIRLFGVLAIEDGTRTLGPRDLGGARPKQVLEILLAARGHRVPTDRLAELLWGEELPQNAAGSLFSSTVTIKINSNPKPGISSITPSSAVAGGPAFTLSLQGIRFVPASIVQWNGSPRSTRFIQNNLGGYLQASILASDIAHSGTAQVTVVNPAPGGGVSNAVTFTISP